MYDRICPGLNLAEATIFAFCAATLAAFNINKVRKNGRAAPLEALFGTGAVR